MKNWKNEYDNLLSEFNQYKKESIKWSVEDFTTLEVEGYLINDQQAQEALEEMIRNHDCNNGITWNDLEYYYEKYGTKL